VAAFANLCSVLRAPGAEARSVGWRLRDYEPSPALALREMQVQTGASLGRPPLRRSSLGPARSHPVPSGPPDPAREGPLVPSMAPLDGSGAPVQAQPCAAGQGAAPLAGPGDEAAPYCGEVGGGWSDDDNNGGGDGGWSDDGGGGGGGGSDGREDAGGADGRGDNGVGRGDAGALHGPDRSAGATAAAFNARAASCERADSDQENGEPQRPPRGGAPRSPGGEAEGGGAHAGVSGVHASRAGEAAEAAAGDAGGAERAPAPPAKPRADGPAHRRLKRAFQQRRSLTGAPRLHCLHARAS